MTETTRGSMAVDFEHIQVVEKISPTESRIWIYGESYEIDISYENVLALKNGKRSFATTQIP